MLRQVELGLEFPPEPEVCTEYVNHLEESIELGTIAETIACVDTMRKGAYLYTSSAKRRKNEFLSVYEDDEDLFSLQIEWYTKGKLLGDAFLDNVKRDRARHCVEVYLRQGREVLVEEPGWYLLVPQ